MTTREDKSFLKQQEALLMLYSAIGAQRKGNSWRDDLKVVLLKACRTQRRRQCSLFERAPNLASGNLRPAPCLAFSGCVFIKNSCNSSTSLFSHNLGIMLQPC